MWPAQGYACPSCLSQTVSKVAGRRQHSSEAPGAIEDYCSTMRANRNMMFWMHLIILLLAAIGNCGFWLYCFNRANSTGLPRRATKRIEKLFVVLCFAIPLVVFWFQWSDLLAWFRSDSLLPDSLALRLWIAASLLAAALLGPFWLESRRWLIPPANLAQQESEEHDIALELDRQDPPAVATGTKLTDFLAALPANDITRLSVTRKTLRLHRSVPSASGLTIGHISDLHFTGQFTPDFYRYVLDRFQELSPDLIAITGDIIDYPKCLPWLGDLLSTLEAPLGCFFVLGNHDRRLPNVDEVSRLVCEAGFTDVGRTDAHIDADGRRIAITGNELPWLRRRVSAPSNGAGPDSDWPIEDPDVLRIGLSHAPDQLPWARAANVDLMLAGHTHGGQARIPLIGPIVAPSRYGSRFASGVFLRPPVLMHVSRGVAGTHPLRFRCMPEVSLLTIE